MQSVLTRAAVIDSSGHTLAQKMPKPFVYSPLLDREHKTGNRVLVTLRDKRVTVYGPSGYVLRQYRAYIGTKAAPTPTGQFRIMENEKPDADEWYLGPRWMGFARGYDQSHHYAGFHGWVYTQADDATEQTEPGWKTTTEGCVQMANNDVADLGDLLGVGDPVTIVDQAAPPLTAGNAEILALVPSN